MHRGKGLPAAPAMAADEAAYLRYHGAVHAAVLCENRSFDQDAHQRLAAVIDEKAGTDLASGLRLSLIERAKSETRDLVFKHRCNSEAVASLLDIFHSELEPAL